MNTTISFEKAIEIALEQHRAGNFSRAESLYMAILQQDPGNVDAIHLLGVLAHQGRKSEIAVQLIRAAISKRPDVPVFHYNLAEALHALAQTQEAIESYRRAVELAPDYFEAHNNLANALNDIQEFKSAENECRLALAIKPNEAAPLNNLGNALRGMGRIGEAITAYRAAMEAQPDFVEATNNLALCLCAVGLFEEAVALFLETIRLRPTIADAHNNLGTALTRMGRHEEAAARFQMAIDLKPDHAEAINNLGSTFRTLGNVEQSVSMFKKAVELKPDFLVARSNLATALSDLGRKPEALEAIDAVLAVNPDLAKEQFVRATILRDLSRPDEGINAIREVLRLEPDSVSGLTALGYALLERGDLDEATAVLRRSIELKPDPQTHSNVLLTINYHPGYSPADLFEAHQSWSTQHETPFLMNPRRHANDRAPGRKLRVGYVSPDFRGHSVSYFLSPILENHDRSKFEVFAYAHVINADLHTWRLRAQIDHWREIAGRTPDAIADQIRTDQIDILIELAGHTGNNSLPVFARKPAPVQINMIGFPSTTGLKGIDYRITDALCDLPGVSDPYNSESLVRMPDIFWCYQPPDSTPEVGPLPATKNGFVTFTSVNNFTKVTPQVQELWARVLLAIPSSRLILQTSALSSEHTKAQVISRFSRVGVSADRLDFRGWSSFGDYMHLLEQSDMTLDPFPFNGGTTTCHSLWMGAPVVTLAGDRHASRMGLSMMTCIGLPEFVAHTPDEYVEIAVKMANDLARLQEIREGMRDRLKASPLLDAVTYTRNLEAAYRTVWKKWCETGT